MENNNTNNNNTMYHKTIGYLREHNIIQPNEQIPESLLTGIPGVTPRTSGFEKSAKFYTGILTSCITAIFIIFVIVTGRWFLLYGYYKIIPISGIVASLYLYIIPAIKYYKKRQSNDLNLRRENRIVDIFLISKTGVTIFLRFSGFVSVGSVVLMLILMYYGYIIYLFSIYGIWFLFLITIISTVCFYLLSLKNEMRISQTHYFITSKRIYFNLDMFNNPYTIINICDLTQIESHTNINHGRKGNRTYEYMIHYRTTDNTNLALRVDKQNASEETLRTLFPNTHIIFETKHFNWWGKLV